MRNIFKDLIDVAKYKKRSNTAENKLETVNEKYVELLEKFANQDKFIPEYIFDINKKLKKLNKRVSDLETKKKIK